MIALRLAALVLERFFAVIELTVALSASASACKISRRAASPTSTRALVCSRTVWERLSWEFATVSRA